MTHNLYKNLSFRCEDQISANGKHMVPSASSETGIGLQSPGAVPELITNGSHTVQSLHSETDIGLQPPSTMP
jgi:hypothetical protein